MAALKVGLGKVGVDKVGPVADAATSPQRTYLWRPVALIALGFFAAEETTAAPQPSLHAYRAHPDATGHVTVPTNQLVLITGEQDAVRVNHSQRLMFNRGAGAAPPTAGAPWTLWVKPAQQIEPEEDARRGDHTLLHRYRVGYQTVGQPWQALQFKTSQPEQPEAYDVRSARPDLHLYRQAYQTVGHGYRLWPRTINRVEADEYTIPAPVDLRPYRNSQPAGAGPGQPWYLWPAAKADQSIEPDAVRTDHARRLLFGRTTPTGGAGAPWYLWKSQARVEAEEDIYRGADHSRLHRYRVGYQTVGQSRQLWTKPQQRLDAEDYTVPRPASLIPYLRITSQPGQPWWAWPKAVADQTTEPNPRVTDHAAALYPFRPHDAITFVFYTADSRHRIGPRHQHDASERIGHSSQHDATERIGVRRTKSTIPRIG